MSEFQHGGYPGDCSLTDINERGGEVFKPYVRGKMSDWLDDEPDPFYGETEAEDD